MQPISWKSYYDKFYDWEESTQKNYSNRLSDFGPAEEVWEIAQEFAFSDEKFASNFIQRALDTGVRFTPEQVLEMAVNIEKHILGRAAELSSIPFQREELEEIYMLIDDKSFERISARSKIDIFTDEEAEDPEAFDDEETILPPARSPGLLTTLLAAFAFRGSGKKRDFGRCDGDCAHCPLAYIAGYTSGGAAYGLQWEDVGIDPDLPFDEKVRLYRSGTY